ncbi:MAG: phosphoribosylglycinamide formyltransferase [Candidatus Cyclobacteriaceae bacterium M2_1C_046]
MSDINIAIFASGSGSNAEEIIKYFRGINDINVKLILTNRPDAYVVKRAEKYNIDHVLFTRKDFYETGKVLEVLKENSIDFMVLAGFLWLIPTNIINRYSNKIINIHPALLPKFGGKGMYGASVHEAVKAAKEKETGITIHYVNESYDEGNIIFQAHCPVFPEDSVEDIQKRVHALEYEHFPSIIEKTIRKAFKK